MRVAGHPTTASEAIVSLMFESGQAAQLLAARNPIALYRAGKTLVATAIGLTTGGALLSPGVGGIEL